MSPVCRKTSILGLLAFALQVLIACGSTVRGATEQQLASAQTVSPQGAELFKTACAGCHGARGQGTESAPPLMGPGALPVRRQEQMDSALLADPGLRSERERTTVPGSAAGRDLRMPFNTAADIHHYLMTDHARLRGTGELNSDQLWQALTYVLAAHGLKVPPSGLTAANAKSVVNRAE